MQVQYVLFVYSRAECLKMVDMKLLPFSGHECLASLTKIDDNFMQFEIMSRLASSHASKCQYEEEKKIR